MNKRKVITFLVMIAGIFGLGFIAPWWVAAIWVVVIAALSKLNSRDIMPIGGIAFGMVWLVVARYMSLQDAADIITKTGTLLGLSYQLMRVATGLIAAITGILSGWFGSALGNIIWQKNK